MPFFHNENELSAQYSGRGSAGEAAAAAAGQSRSGAWGASGTGQGGSSFTGGTSLAGCCNDESPDMMSFVGAGRGEFIQETSYKYVGSGAGEYHVVKRDYTCAVGVGFCCAGVILLLLLAHSLPLEAAGGQTPLVDCNALVAEQASWTKEQQAQCCATALGGCVQPPGQPALQPQAGLAQAAPPVASSAPLMKLAVAAPAGSNLRPPLRPPAFPESPPMPSQAAAERVRPTSLEQPSPLPPAALSAGVSGIPAPLRSQKAPAA